MTQHGPTSAEGLLPDVHWGIQGKNQGVFAGGEITANLIYGKFE